MNNENSEPPSPPRRPPVASLSSVLTAKAETPVSPVPPPLPRRVTGEPAESAGDGPSFYHRAATGCVLAPFLALGANILLTGAGVSRGSGVLVVALLLSLLLVLGAVLGVIALFGIRRHGTKGILVKSLVGLSIFTFLLLIAIPAFIKGRAEARRMQEWRQERPGR